MMSDVGDNAAQAGNPLPVDSCAGTVPARISCLLLPLVDYRLLVPVTAVAEVITAPVIRSGVDGGLLHGWLRWREQQVPLVSFAAACGGRAEQTARGHVAIFNAIDRAAGLGFYALPLAAIPRLVQVVPGTVLRPAGDGLELLAWEAFIGETRAWVPRLDLLEERLAATALL